MLLGSARSGTTWVQDVLAQANGRRTIFEPLNPEGDPRAKPFAHVYLNANDEAPALAELLGEAVSGRGLRLWWDLRVSPPHVFRWQSPKGYAAQALYTFRGLTRYRRERGQATLTKLIRGNLLGGWLTHQMDARVALVLRHPCAVVASQLRVDPSAWHDHHKLLRSYLGHERLVDEYLAPHHDLLANVTDATEVHAALWCIENVIPLRRATEDGVVPVYYERLLSHDSAEWHTLLDALALRSAPDEALTARPSQQASSDMRSVSFDAETMGRWRQRLDAGQVSRIGQMLDRFEVTAYSCDFAMPLV